MHLLPLLLSAATVLTSTAQQTTSILSLDLGTSHIKSSLLKPSRPFDVLLDRDSKRKVYHGVYLPSSHDEYKVGGSAETLLTRYPERSYPNLGLLLDEEGRALWESLYGKGRVEEKDGRTWVDGERTEELNALVLSYFKGLAESELNSGQKNGGKNAEEKEEVKDVVVTVPPYFTQVEKQIIINATTLMLRLRDFEQFAVEVQPRPVVRLDLLLFAVEGSPLEGVGLQRPHLQEKVSERGDG
ncbi:hypothetical protein BT69DRAFT_1350741 [Atractiella rhizophila]|nr:hypothetical protein BT69DRAFT_1350741 [Atractiella rhizophila]